MPFLRVPEAVNGGNGGRRAPQEGPLDEGHELGGQPKVAAVDPSWPRERNHSPSSVPRKPVLKAPQGGPQLRQQLWGGAPPLQCAGVGLRTANYQDQNPAIYRGRQHT
jgi:hypothetical protein